MVRALLVAALLTAPAWGGDDQPARHQHYQLERRAGEVAEVALTESGFFWPRFAAPPDTVLLEFEIERARASSAGEPSVVFSLGAIRRRQYLQPREAGRRLLELSALAAAARAGDFVALRGQGVDWRTGPARLVGFHTAPLAGRRVLVVAPHPDDAEIAAFGLYSGSDADVVTVTAGDAGGRNYRSLFTDDGEHYRVKGMIRTWDSITVPLLGGVQPERARNLGYYDATLERMWQERPAPVAPRFARLDRPDAFRRANVSAAVRERPMTPTWPSLVDDLRAELDWVAPAVVVAPHPLLDQHRDHRYTALALFEALAEWPGAPAVELFLYTNHPVGAEPFPWGPRDGVVTLWPWWQGELPFSRVYSHQLDTERQAMKLLALEAMHDLRPFDLAALGAAAPEALAKKERRRAERERATYSYPRRAARPNEIFLVLTASEAAVLRQRFLDEVALSPSSRSR